MIRNLFSFIWDITRWNWVDIEIATGGKPNKSTGKIIALWKNLTALAYTMPCITIDWNQSTSHYQRWNGLTWDSIDRLHAWYCVRQGCRSLSKCNKFSCTFVWFSTRFKRVMSQNKRKQITDQIHDLLFLSRDYISGVMIKLIY